jgi:GxxExxY protein
MSINELSYTVRGAMFEVYKTLGPGLLESIYESALVHELELIGLKVRRQVTLPVRYKDIELDINLRIDLIVEDQIILEIKSVEELNSVHYKQLLSYLKLTKLKLGLLVNFNSDNVNNTIHRVVNKL